MNPTRNLHSDSRRLLLEELPAPEGKQLGLFGRRLRNKNWKDPLWVDPLYEEDLYY